MSEIFDQIQKAVDSGGADHAFALLADKFRAEKNYAMLFEARVMEQRHRLGLPPLRVDGLDDVPETARRSYEEGLARAARETGELFLADGDIQRAWPYFRAIGERVPVASAIGQLAAADDAVIQIALEERVHPQKGFELLLSRYGICRAITYFHQYPDRETREASLILLIRTLHRDLLASLRRAIVEQEGTAPETQNVPGLIAGRDWLFGELDYYVDTSHLISVIRFALDLNDLPSLRLAIEMCEYGKHLSEKFQFKLDPPFEDGYTDHALYLGALAGEDIDAAVAHFRNKAHAARSEPGGTAPAQVLVALLVRLKRYAQAATAARELLAETNGEQLMCPSAEQLCQLAGDYEQLKSLARERGDLLAFTAALIGS